MTQGRARGRLQCPGPNTWLGRWPQGTALRGPCSPAGSVGEHDIAVLVLGGGFQEGDRCASPVPWPAGKTGPLAAACGDKGGQAATVSRWASPRFPSRRVSHSSDRQKAPLTPPRRTGRAEVGWVQAARGPHPQPPPTSCSPVKLPPMTKGMTPPATPALVWTLLPFPCPGTGFSISHGLLL